jgi:hypothetical protein
MWRGGRRPLLLNKEILGAYGVSCGYSPFADDPVVEWHMGVSQDYQIELRKTFSMSELERLRGYNLRHHGIGPSNASGTL